MTRRSAQPLVGWRVRLRDWTGVTQMVDVLDLTAARARFRLSDGTKVATTRARFDSALERAARA